MLGLPHEGLGNHRDGARHGRALLEGLGRPAQERGPGEGQERLRQRGLHALTAARGDQDGKDFHRDARRFCRAGGA